MRTLRKVMCIFDGHDIEERELSPLKDFIRGKWESNLLDLLPARMWSTMLQSVWKASRTKASESTRSSATSGPGTPLSALALDFPRTTDGRGQLTQHKTPTLSSPSMAFFGLRKWSTPVSAKIFTSG